MDIVFIGLALLFFVLAWGLVELADRLSGG